MGDHLSRLDFDQLDLADLQIVFGDRPAELARAVEVRYPKSVDQATREMNVRGIAIDIDDRTLTHLIRTADLRTINGEPVLYASDIDQLCDDLAEAGNRFLSMRLKHCVMDGVTLFDSILSERAESKAQAEAEGIGQ